MKLVIIVYLSILFLAYVMVSKTSRNIFYSIPITVTVLIIGLVLLKYMPNYIRWILGFICGGLALFYFITTLDAIKGNNAFDYCCQANSTIVNNNTVIKYSIANDCVFMYNDINACTSKDAFNHIYNKDYDMILVLFNLAVFVLSYFSVLIIPKKKVVKQEEKVKTKEEKEKEDNLLHKHIEEKKIKYYSFILLQFLSIIIAFGGEIYLYVIKKSSGYGLISSSLLAIYVVYTIYLLIMTLINTFCTSWNCLEGIDILIYMIVTMDLIICSGDNLMNFKDTYSKCCLNSQSIVIDEQVYLFIIIFPPNVLLNIV